MTEVPRTLRLLASLVVLALGLTGAAPMTVRATGLAPLLPDVYQLRPVGPRAAEPSPIVQQAFDLLMDRFVVPPSSADVIAGGLDGAREFLTSKGVDLPAEAAADPSETAPGEPMPALADLPPSERVDRVRRAPALAVALTGDRDADWQRFLDAYRPLALRLGGKAPHEQFDRAIVAGMAGALKEGHTYYMTPEEFNRQQNDLQNRNQYGGVGISMSQEMVILDVFEGSPAEAAGVYPGDKLLAVNGESIEGLTSTETSSRVRGEVGTSVTLTLQRADLPDPVDKTIVRATISIQWVTAKILDGRIGYLKIQAFANPDALPYFEQAIQRFLDADVHALVIDLRNNAGGAVSTGQAVASRLIPPDRPIYRQVDRGRGEQTVSAGGSYWQHDIPIAVLTNENSSSMSEILASALQENGVGRVFGMKTAGAVAAGIPYQLADGSGLLVTVQTIVSGQGKVLNQVGLQPDVEVTLDAEQFRRGKDTQLDAALGYLRDRLNG